jgi:phosphoribosylformylglycinamidine synthase
LGGAAFASRDLTDASHEDRPAVQVGDPFMEKLLLEACLELIETGSVVGMQDMGAAGLTCSTCETASRSNTGIQIDLAKVPRRETGMNAYEIMLSESQERMLVIAEKGKEAEVERVMSKWDLHAVHVGEVTEGHRMKVFDSGRLVADIPAKSLTEDVPMVERSATIPAYLSKVTPLEFSHVAMPKDLGEVLLRLLDSPSIASKRWIFEQYDHMVMTNTVFLPGHDAALVRLKGTQKGIAVSVDGNGLYTYLDPYEGGKIAVAESARNVVCSGALPIGLSNCLNFGNPLKPDVFWQFRRAVEGMSDACRAFGIPVTGGNVSFYNENPQGTIYPTPTVAMVGLLENIDMRVGSFFRQPGDTIYLLGETYDEIGGSQYLLAIHGERRGRPPILVLEKEKALHELLLSLAEKRILQSCHDISDGGFAVALSECLLGDEARPLGARITETGWAGALRRDCALFSESQSRAIVSVAPKDESLLEQSARQKRVSIFRIGAVAEGTLDIGDWIRLSADEIARVYTRAIARRLET